MDIVALYLANPFWWWVAAGVALLAIEVATGAELFLWPAVAAGVMAVVFLLGLKMPLGVDLAIFAVLTIAGTIASRRTRQKDLGPDINDASVRLVGRQGLAVTVFEDGRGRVAVEGAEWAAEAEEEQAVASGQRIEVLSVLDGGRLKVRPV